MDQGEFAASLECQAATLLSLLNAHFYKENHVLFPMSIRTLDVHEWNDARKQFDEIGCCNFVQHQAIPGLRSGDRGGDAPASKGQEIVLPTGRFTTR